MSPRGTAEPTGVPINSYGKPTATILPTPRNNNQAPAAINRPIPTYPTTFAANNLNFQAQQPVDHGHQQTYRISNDIHTNRVNLISAFTPNPNTLPMYNNAPLMIQTPPHEDSLHIPQLNGGPNPEPAHHFPFRVGHSTNLLLLPLQERQMYRLLPTVVPIIAGFCDWCGKCYDLIALETLGEYLVATAYDGETVRDRGVRSRAFIDGFEAALFSFKGAGLLQTHGCSEPVVQE